jgi:hypothetical protein
MARETIIVSSLSRVRKCASSHSWHSLFHLSNNSLAQEEKEDTPPPLDEGDIALLKSYGLGPYSTSIKVLEEEIKAHQQTVKDLIGIKESDTGLSPPSMWDLVGDKQMMSEEAPVVPKLLPENRKPTKKRPLHRRQTLPTLRETSISLMSSRLQSLSLDWVKKLLPRILKKACASVWIDPSTRFKFLFRQRLIRLSVS